MRASTSLRQARESLAQSRLEGGRSAGRSARASRIEASGMPVAPLISVVALGGDQALGLVEAQRRGRDAAALRDLADRQVIA